MRRCDVAGDERVVVSYWMNRLQRLDEPAHDYLVTLNARRPHRPGRA